MVKRKVPPNAAGPVVSLSLRLHDLACAVKLEPNTLLEVAAEFAEARQVTCIPGLLGLAAHPDIVMCGRKKWRLVLCRSDVSGQFPELSHVEAWHKKDRDKQEGMAQKLLPREDLAITYDNLRAKALRAHFLAAAEASPDMMFALPSEALACETNVSSCVVCRRA